MTAADTLRAARELLAEPDAWMQGDFAADECGDPVGALSEHACAWCSDGAILAAGLSFLKDISACNYLRRAIGTADIWKWNDAPERTHADVLWAFTVAITLAESDLSKGTAQ